VAGVTESQPGAKRKIGRSRTVRPAEIIERRITLGAKPLAGQAT
jgi:hypothetical protein